MAKLKKFDNPALEIIWLARTLSIEHHPQRKVLLAFHELCADEDFAYRTFGSIAEHTKLEWKRVRVLTRRLAGKGLLVYANGLFGRDGNVAGAGYTITAKGRSVAELIKEYRNDRINL